MSVKILFHIVILKGCDVMIAVVLTFIGKDAQDFASRIEGGQAGNGQFNSHAAEVKAVAFRMLAVGQGIEYQVDFACCESW